MRDPVDDKRRFVPLDKDPWISEKILSAMGVPVEESGGVQPAAAENGAT